MMMLFKNNIKICWIFKEKIIKLQFFFIKILKKLKKPKKLKIK